MFFCETSMPARRGNSEKTCVQAEKVMGRGFSIARFFFIGDDYGTGLPGQLGRRQVIAGGERAKMIHIQGIRIYGIYVPR